METIKVSKTREVKLGNINENLFVTQYRQCAEAKLVLVKDEKQIIQGDLWQSRKSKKLCISKFDYSLNHSEVVRIKPIIISETEEILEGDMVLWNDIIDKFTFNTSDENSDGWIGNSLSGCSVNIDDCSKILALPEHFTSEQLQAIVDGKMKDGDKVMVECERNPYYNTLGLEKTRYYIIKQPLTLHKAEESWDDIWRKANSNKMKDSEYWLDDIFNWLDENYFPPKRKS